LKIAGAPEHRVSIFWPSGIDPSIPGVCDTLLRTFLQLYILLVIQLSPAFSGRDEALEHRIS
jgi:hypothetical protein